MLDLAYDLAETSRLGCQIYLTKDMNGLEVKVCEPNFPSHLVVSTNAPPIGSDDGERRAIVRDWQLSGSKYSQADNFFSTYQIFDQIMIRYVLLRGLRFLFP
jgi:hypothetical protein